MPPPGGGICIGVDYRNDLFALGMSPGWGVGCRVWDVGCERNLDAVFGRLLGWGLKVQDSWYGVEGWNSTV